MQNNDPRLRRAVARPLPGPVDLSGFGPYPAVRLNNRRRRGSSVAAFVRGYVIGLAGASLLAAAALIAFLLFFPTQRINVLVLGLDRRPDENHYITRTDTMILATVDPRGVYAGMLSIPRDLWITLPGGGPGRINSAHVFAEAAQAGSGPGASMDTVRTNFGVDVHRYVRLDLVGFVRIVDAMGGIELDVPRPLIDYQYPTYDYGTQVVAFEAGPQVLDGERALAYARIRHGSSDFQRAERQQLVVQAIFRRLLSPQTWPRLPALAVAVSESLDTDLTALDLALMAPTLLRVGPEGLDRRVIQSPMVQSHTTAGGASVQLPVWNEINPVLLEMFGQ